ncbi:sex comb on midleg-like protein 4 [Syngnathus scovelli]|uniref:sex comb on midleg-like protein 4 n=1 Tax=Syngnathus scovelli TaxID=161590 RepID=UPI00211083FD|nr:sex comb on midleg-like protein 4 [Syngnathus scovelli]XP_049596813.1 sex comb on midleg-like protein 4 [Syngnathus scovelli]XP_049596814.1 sex comb on midleg-like protein 4 [Syngnathus scovelli]XP_049596815.1 sex comb on midleg-like protein 4 [Syngnathus scovelli]XP_049596816.1 sex comb on midleg-like protein 4 [Syngnathus scovelli]
MSAPAATVQQRADDDNDSGEMQSAAVAPSSFMPGQSGKIPGRKRGRPPLRSVAKIDFASRYVDSLPPLKVPKKRGRKPGFKLKPRMVMTPLAISPPSSTPEPDMSSIPQDAATIPHSATPQVLTVCIYINKQANTGPNLDRKKIQQLPDHFGPDRPSVVLQQAVQGCIDSAFQQKTVFTLLTQGYGGEKISATFDGKQHLLSLPVVNSIDYVLRFLKKLCRSLHCENLFSDQPISQRPSYHSDAETSLAEDYRHEQSEGKRYPAAEHRESAFGSISSSSYSSSPKSSYGFRSSQQFGNASAVSRQSSGSPGAFVESNRAGAYVAQESKGPSPGKDPSTWSVDDVVWFIRDADANALGPHADVFRKHEIDGNALLLLKSDMIMKYLGLKLGPALKLCYHIDKLKQSKL